MRAGCCDEMGWRRMVSRRRLLRGGMGLALAGTAVPLRGFSVLANAQDPGATPVGGGGAAVVAEARYPIVNGSFVAPLVEDYGDVFIGQRCYIAGNTILLAGDGHQIVLGDENNCQDNAYLLASDADLRFANMVSIAHHAVIEDSVIGDFTFFGFRCRVRRATIGEGAMIMHNTSVEGVEIPPNRITPMGVRITSQDQADALPSLEEANDEFKREVQDVNLEFVDGYTRLFEERGRVALEGTSPNPITSWNPEYLDPQVGENTTLGELVRIIGDVRLGEDSAVGQRTAIRADEGTPIVIGRRARIQSRVTFHALKGTRLDLGANARIGDGNVLHGPLSVGDNFVTGDDCVVFRATIEDNVELRDGATVAGECTIREGSIVPEGAVVATQEEADALPQR